MTNTPLAIRKLESVLFRAPIDEPLRTSFGVLHNRPALLVRAEDADGVVGWGEVWCTFPPCGAEHQVALIDTLLAPIVTGADWDDPVAAFAGAVGEVLEVMAAAEVAEPFRMTAAVSDGESIHALRYASDDKAPTLYYGNTDGRQAGESVLILSEPLDQQAGNWTAIPQAHTLTASGGTIAVTPFSPAG